MIQYYEGGVVVDSLVWIGAFSDRDQYRNKSKLIFDSLTKDDTLKIYVTDYILIETVNFLLRKENFNAAFLVLNLFLQSENIEMSYVDKMMMDNMKEIFEKYKNLSLTDCSIVALMKEKNLKQLFSFDSGFDKVKEIIRKDYV